MKYLACVRRALDAPFEERCTVTEDYAEFCRKTKAMAKKFLSPVRAKAISMLLADFEQGGNIHIDDFIMASSPEVEE